MGDEAVARLVKHVWAVRCGEDDDGLVALEAIHLAEDLV